MIALTALLPRAAGVLSLGALLLLSILFGAATLQLPASAQDTSPFTTRPRCGPASSPPSPSSG